MELAKQGKISFNEDAEVSNTVSAMDDPLNEPVQEVRFSLFPSVKTKVDLTSPMLIGGPTPSHAPMTRQKLEIEPRHRIHCKVKEDEWILVTQRQKYKKVVPKVSHKSPLQLSLMRKRLTNP